MTWHGLVLKQWADSWPTSSLAIITSCGYWYLSCLCFALLCNGLGIMTTIDHDIVHVLSLLTRRRIPVKSSIQRLDCWQSRVATGRWVVRVHFDSSWTLCGQSWSQDGAIYKTWSANATRILPTRIRLPSCLDISLQTLSKPRHHDIVTFALKLFTSTYVMH